MMESEKKKKTITRSLLFYKNKRFICLLQIVPVYTRLIVQLYLITFYDNLIVIVIFFLLSTWCIIMELLFFSY